MRIVYATGNSHKVESANQFLKKFKIKVEGIPVPQIIEIQTDDIFEITKNKAEQAFGILKKPLIVSDSGWSITVLNGFPGPMMAFVNNWFSVEDFLNLMRSKKNKEIILKEFLVYIDSRNIKTFSQEKKASFVDKPKGKGTNLDQVITFREDGKTVAQCLNEGIKAIEQGEMWEELGEYLLKKKKQC